MAIKRRRGEGTRFQIDRKFFSSDIWVSGSEWKLRLWVYLMGNANYKDVVWKKIKIKRGQIIRSYRRLAEEISYCKGIILKKPSTSVIGALFKEFEKEKRVKLTPLVSRDKSRTRHAGFLITLLNYNTLQGFITCAQDTNRTESKKDKTIYSLFEFWNSLKIMQHKKVDKFVSSLNNALKDYPGIQVRKAMVNYATVIKGDKYFFKYRWTLKAFLTRGIERFLDTNKPLENFLIDKEGEAKEIGPKYEEKK